MVQTMSMAWCPLGWRAWGCRLGAIAAFVASSLIVPATVFAAPMEVDKPVLRPGDQWTYRRVDLWRNEESERFRVELLGAIGDSATVLWTILSSSEEARRGSVTQEFMDVATHAFYDPKTVGRDVPLKFPLFVGKTWSFDYTYHRQANFRVLINQAAKVEGWETVSVPAGSFRALKVHHNGFFHTRWGIDDSWPGTIKVTYWYAPEVKRVVRMEYRDTGYSGGGVGGPWDMIRDELVDYKLSKEK